VGKWAERAGSAHISNRRPKPYPRLSWFSAGSRGTIDTRASLAGYAQKRSISWASLCTALAIKKETFESGFLRRTHDCDAHSSAWGIRPPAEISVKIHHRLFRQSKTASDVPIPRGLRLPDKGQNCLVGRPIGPFSGRHVIVQPWLRRLGHVHGVVATPPVPKTQAERYGPMVDFYTYLG
jgi:hypothetical protein